MCQQTEFSPLTDDEAALFYTVQMYGSSAYPITKLQGSNWLVGPWRGWKGFPTVFKTKTKAVAMFEGWIKMALERWHEMRKRDSSLMMTAVGIKRIS